MSCYISNTLPQKSKVDLRAHICIFLGYKVRKGIRFMTLVHIKFWCVETLLFMSTFFLLNINVKILQPSFFQYLMIFSLMDLIQTIWLILLFLLHLFCLLILLIFHFITYHSWFLTSSSTYLQSAEFFPLLRRSTRVTKPPAWLKDFASTVVQPVSHCQHSSVTKVQSEVGSKRL